MGASGTVRAVRPATGFPTGVLTAVLLLGADRIARGPLPADEAVEIARQIAEALEAAHDLGIVRRFAAGVCRSGSTKAASTPT